jgi:hypothetical protein
MCQACPCVAPPAPRSCSSSSYIPRSSSFSPPTPAHSVSCFTNLTCSPTSQQYLQYNHQRTHSARPTISFLLPKHSTHNLHYCLCFLCFLLHNPSPLTCTTKFSSPLPLPVPEPSEKDLQFTQFPHLHHFNSSTSSVAIPTHLNYPRSYLLSALLLALQIPASCAASPSPLRPHSASHTLLILPSLKVHDIPHSTRHFPAHLPILHAQATCFYKLLLSSMAAHTPTSLHSYKQAAQSALLCCWMSGKKMLQLGNEQVPCPRNGGGGYARQVHKLPTMT